jgi:hypothetical protein
MTIVFTARVRKEGAIGITYLWQFEYVAPANEPADFSSFAIEAIGKAGYEFHGDLRFLRTVP